MKNFNCFTIRRKFPDLSESNKIFAWTRVEILELMMFDFERVKCY